MTHALVYWILMLDNIKNLFGGGAFVLLVMLIIGVFIFGNIHLEDCYEKECKTCVKAWKTVKISFFTIIFVFLLFVFTPYTKQMAAIYLIPKIASNKDIKQLPPKLSKLMMAYVNKELNNLSSNKSSD